jgi:charged multivesicular body protein 7
MYLDFSRPRDVTRYKTAPLCAFPLNTMSKSSPPTPSSASLPPSLATSLPPFSTTSIARLQALYSDFSRQKHNATSYHANVAWWRDALEALVSSGKQVYQNHLHFDGDAESSGAKSDRLVLHARRELIERLKIPKAGKPLALGTVLVRKKKHSFMF